VAIGEKQMSEPKFTKEELEYAWKDLYVYAAEDLTESNWRPLSHLEHDGGEDERWEKWFPEEEDKGLEEIKG